MNNSNSKYSNQIRINSKPTLVRSKRSWVLKLPNRTVVTQDLRIVSKTLNDYYDNL